jgi:hypothetical protein
MTGGDHKRSLFACRRAAILTAVAAGVAVLLILAPSAVSPAQPAKAADVIVPVLQPPGSSEQFGANTGVLFNDRRSTPAQINAQLAALAQTGATVVRSDALWEDAEPAPPIGPVHRYDWGFDDLIAGSLAAHGLQWLPIIDYSAPWAQSISGRDHSPPASPSDYAAYAAAIASRYGPGGLFWIENPQLTPLPVGTYEIWNEPDNPAFWYPAPNPSAYASLYTSARNAITAVQSGAHVIVGGLIQPASFLSAMLAADPGMQAQIDGVAIHPYGARPRDVLAGVRSARLAMRSDGLSSVPLYVTEFGWTTHPSRGREWASEQVRPSYILRTISALGHTDCAVAAVVLYAWATRERDPANAQDWFGISPPSADGTPDTAAFTSALRAAAAPRPTSSLCSGSATVASPRVSRRRSRARVSRHSRRSSRDRRHRTR